MIIQFCIPHMCDTFWNVHNATATNNKILSLTGHQFDLPSFRTIFYIVVLHTKLTHDLLVPFNYCYILDFPCQVRCNGSHIDHVYEDHKRTTFQIFCVTIFDAIWWISPPPPHTHTHIYTHATIWWSFFSVASTCCCNMTRCQAPSSLWRPCDLFGA